MSTTIDTITTTDDVFTVLQDLVRVHTGAADTGDAGFFVMEVTVPPGGGPPPIHTHVPHELFFTLEGELTYFRDDGGDGLTVITGGPGTTAFIPSRVPHTYRNFSDATARYLGVVGPGRAMEDFLRAAGVRPGDPPRTPDEVIAMSAEHGFTWTDVVPGPQG